MRAVHLIHELLMSQQKFCSKVLPLIICLELVEGSMHEAPPHGSQEKEETFPLVRGPADVTHHDLSNWYDGYIVETRWINMKRPAAKM